MEKLIEILPFVSIFISVGGIIYTYFSMILKQNEKIADIDVRLACITTKTELFWNIVEDKMTDVLKNYPTNIHKDVLLDKMKEKTLSIEEAEVLRTILSEDMKVTEKDRISYVLMLARLEQILYELRSKVKHDTDHRK